MVVRLVCGRISLRVTIMGWKPMPRRCLRSGLNSGKVQRMFLKRLVLFLVPVFLIGCYVAAYMNVRGRSYSDDRSEIVLAVTERTEGFNPLRIGNRTTEQIERLLFNSLLERDESLKLQPGRAKISLVAGKQPTPGRHADAGGRFR